MLIRNWSGSPMKILLTLTAVALGTGILILANSAGKILDEQISRELESEGLILYMANADWDSNGKIDLTRPPEWDASAPSVLVSDIEEINSAVPVFSPTFDQITTEGQSYNMRTSVGSGPGYFEIFSLDIIAGVPMSEEDVNMGIKKVWISSEMAQILYGSSEEALGKWIQPPGESLQRGPGRREVNRIQQYSVAGVFESPGEVARRSYSIGDLIFPYTALFTAGENIQLMKDMMSGQIVLQADGSSVEKITASINELMTGIYGYDIDLLVWEGSPNGTSSYMEELRQSVKIFSVSLSLLGMVLLLTSSLGIFSIMVVEALNRRRDIALERSLGASQHMVIREFWTWSIALSLTGAVLGVIISLLLSHPVLSTLSPLVGEVSSQFSEAAGVRFSSVLLGVFLAVLFGGVLGLLPSFSAVKGNIAETLREA